MGRSGEFPLAASAKANCLGDTRGLVKVFEKEGRLVGAYIIAPHAGEIIGEAALAIRMKLSPKDVFDTIHAHPTFQRHLRKLRELLMVKPSIFQPKVEFVNIFILITLVSKRKKIKQMAIL